MDGWVDIRWMDEWSYARQRIDRHTDIQHETIKHRHYRAVGYINLKHCLFQKILFGTLRDNIDLKNCVLISEQKYSFIIHLSENYS